MGVLSVLKLQRLPWATKLKSPVATTFSFMVISWPYCILPLREVRQISQVGSAKE